MSRRNFRCPRSALPPLTWNIRERGSETEPAHLGGLHHPLSEGPRAAGCLTTTSGRVLSSLPLPVRSKAVSVG